MNTTRIIIAGSRWFDDWRLLQEVMNDYIASLAKPNHTLAPIEIISGGARGADRLGERYAKLKGYILTRFPADWDRYGKSAGFKRNVQMAEYASPDGHCITFWDGESPGTNHMRLTAIRHGIKLHTYTYTRP
jgi:hypothetical protein